MSIFGSIMSAIFGSAKAQTSTAPAGTGGPAAPPLNAPVPPGPTPLSDVDVAAVLTGLAAKSKEKLDWKKSIVDLMKLLNLDPACAGPKSRNCYWSFFPKSLLKNPFSFSFFLSSVESGLLSFPFFGFVASFLISLSSSVSFESTGTFGVAVSFEKY